MKKAWSQLQAYAQRHDQAAFADLVAEHLSLVYSAALRQLGDPATAEEVTQAVFVLLAEKAPTLRPTGSLATWLYRVTCLKAKKVRRQEHARRRREDKAHAMDILHATANEEPDWERVAPLLDEAMASLPEKDRTAVLLRYFQKRSLREVGESLGVSEEAARKRVDRAVERLRLWFEGHGVTCSAGALAPVISANSLQALPDSLTVSSIQALIPQASAVSSTTLFTLMASTKTLFTSALLLGAALPLSLPYLRDSASSALPLELPVEKRVTLRIPNANASGLIAEWEALMADHGPANGSLAEVYDAIKNIPDDFRRRAFRGALITEWIARSPGEALAYLREEDSGRVTSALREWLQVDPSAAIAAMLADPEALKGSIASLLGEIAESYPEGVPGLARYVEKKSSWTHHVRDAFATLSAANPVDALEKAESLEGPQRAEALAGVAKGWAKVNGEEALAWAQGLDDATEGKGWVLQSLLVGWAETDPAAALDHVSIAPPGGSDLEFANDTGGQVIRAAAKADFEATVKWIGENPGKFSGESLGGLSEELGKRLRSDTASTLDFIRDHPAANDLMPALSSQLLNQGYAERDAVWEWLDRQEASPLVEEMRLKLWRSAAWKEPDVALQWLEEKGAVLDERERSQLISNMFNGGRNLPAVEDALAEASPELRQELLIQSFNYLDNHNTGSLAPWIDRLDELPQDRRPGASAAVARRMAGRDPEQAISWADSLTNSEQAAQALKGAVGIWADLDSYECSQWIAEQPEGSRRDHATSALINSVVQVEPDSAWIWAKTIEDAELRSAALSQAFKKMRENDPQTANTWLQDPTLTQAEVSTLTRE